MIGQYGGWIALVVGLFCLWRLMLKRVKYSLAMTRGTLLACVLIALPLSVLLGLVVYPKAEFLWQPFVGGTLILALSLGVVYLFAAEEIQGTDVVAASS
ncbi:MAG: hypothetical protein Q4P71_02375 [Actinomycetaceae bacterium]|nr:hypothetical protein [Actinomycetaceae bacterium]